MLDQKSFLYAAVESERSVLYGMIGDVLCCAPDARTLRGYLDALDADRPPAQWATAHALAQRAIRAGLEADVDAEHKSLSPPFQDRIRQLLHLAMNADRAAQAVAENNYAEAMRAVQAGRELLCGEAGTSLFDFALYLQSSSTSFYAATGVLLREVLDRDLSTLESQGVRVQRWLALSVRQIRRPDGQVVLESLVRCPQQAGDAVSLDLCGLCGRWNGMQYGSKDRPPMILCRYSGVHTSPNPGPDSQRS